VGSSPALSDVIFPPSDSEPSLAALLAHVDAVFGDNPHRTDGSQWVTDRLDEFVWSKQREVMASVVEHRKTAVRSCHGVGKSHIAARLAAWWLDVHPPGEAFVVTTAPTFAQVRAILWRYIGQAHKKAAVLAKDDPKRLPFPGRVNQTEWQIDGELVAFGRKPADTDEAAFQGIHARYVLVILDEACGIPEQIWVAADSLTTNDDCRLLAIGNPDNPATHFRKVCTPGSGWNVIGISAFESPNLTEEVVPESLRHLLVSRDWVEEKKREWGESNPLYLSKVLGQFPSDDPNAVVPASYAARATAVRDIEYTPEQLLPVELGIDIGGGGDETVIRERRGLLAGREWANRESDSEKVAEDIVMRIVETGATSVKIDSTGIGHGIVGHVRALLRDRGIKCNVVPVNNGSASSEPKRFLNLRAEIWWAVGRELSEKAEWDLSSGVNMDAAVAQLCEPRWDLDPKGKIRVEKKEDVIVRLGRSPDNADALLLAYYTGKGQGQVFLEAWKKLNDQQASRPVRVGDVMRDPREGRDRT
jgi:hypothetical protein